MDEDTSDERINSINKSLKAMENIDTVVFTQRKRLLLIEGEHGGF